MKTITRAATAALLLAAAAWGQTKTDAYGYTAGSTIFNYLDISAAGGGASTVLAGTDDGTAYLTLPFSFTFYGTSYSSICVSSNGIAYFTSSSACSAITDFSNVDTTTATTPSDTPALMPFWTDLSFAVAGAGAVYYQGFGTVGSRQFVIQWYNAYAATSSSPVNFQIVLAEGTNSITFQYQTVALGSGDPASDGGSATVGIYNTGGLTSNNQIEWSYSSPVLSNGYALIFQTSAAPSAPTLTAPANAASGVASPATLTWNAASAAISYDVHFGTATTPPLATNTTSTSYTTPSLTAGTTYYWQIVAKNFSGSASSVVNSFTVAAAGGGGGGGGGGNLPTTVSQTISFSAIPNQTTDTTSLALSASASSGLPVIFSVVSGPATVSGTTLTITGPGTVVVEADQPGAGNVLAATAVRQTFTVALGNVTISSVLNAASYANLPLAADGYAVAFGRAFAAQSQQAGAPPLPSSLAGASLTITDSAGKTLPALIYYASFTQINFVVPEGLAGGAATVTITSMAGKSATASVTLAAVSPALFTGNASGSGLAAAFFIVIPPGGAAQVIAVGTCTGTPVVCSALPINVSVPNEPVYVSLYGTGIRSAGAAGVTVTAGGVPLQVTYAGAQPTYPGLDQINALLPPSLAGKGLTTLQVTVAGVAANPVTISIQ